MQGLFENLSNVAYHACFYMRVIVAMSRSVVFVEAYR